MNTATAHEVKALQTAITTALDNLQRLTSTPHPAGLDIAGLLAWLASDFPGVIAAIAKLIAILMTQGD